MQVNTSSLNTNLIKLNKHLNDYYNVYLNFYNELKNSHEYANANKTNSFYINAENEKSMNYQFYQELIEIQKIYNYIYDNYSEIGNKIEFDLTKKALIMSTIKNIKTKINSLKRNNKSIDTTYCSQIIPILDSNEVCINNIYNIITEIETNYNKLFNKIDGIENVVRNRISNTDITIIKETDIHPYI